MIIKRPDITSSPATFTFESNSDKVFTALKDLISTINSMPICKEKTDMINELKTLALDFKKILEA